MPSKKTLTLLYLSLTFFAEVPREVSVLPFFSGPGAVADGAPVGGEAAASVQAGVAVGAGVDAARPDALEKEKHKLSSMSGI